MSPAPLLCIACGRAVPAPIPAGLWGGWWRCPACREAHSREMQICRVLEVMVAGLDQESVPDTISRDDVR